MFGVAGRISPGPIGFDVTMIAVDQPTVARHGLTIVADHTLGDAPDLDLVIVPGGITDAVERDDRVLAWLRDRARTPTIASVCTGAFVLAEAGLLTDQRVTTHWDDVDALRERFPALDVVDGPRWVRSGHVFTSAGISAGIDLALHLVGVLGGPDLAVETAHRMDYAWTPTIPEAPEGPQRGT
ncbi:DJ-1/PfpI family protein [Aeromicrobium sp. CF3.5]|uniref:DJ-1/PfpI family protein n=1 Tax=Aeromicrobium sp. CF3.5 TaxID=3373078 RepID=UPI003EE5DC9A